MKRTSITYQIITWLLAVTVLCMPLTLTIDMHYCQGKLKALSFIGKASNCTGSTSSTCITSHTNNEQSTSLSKQRCCENKTAFLQFSPNQESLSFHSNLSIDHNLLIRLFVAQRESYFHTDTQSSPLPFYRPPSINEDIPVLVQAFLC